MNLRMLLTVLLLLNTQIVNRLHAQDWPRWRGAENNGISTESAWKPEALQQQNQLWEAELGTGYSSFSISGKRVYTMGSIGEEDQAQDVVYCLNTDSGKELWRYTYPNKRGGWPGPRVTPTLDDGHVYTISRTGKALCLAAKTGKLIWQRDLAAEGKAVDPDCGISGSPLIYRDRVIFNAGASGVALNKKTGQVIWHSGSAKGGFASPVLYTLNGTDHVSILGRETLFDVNPATGEINWSMPWATKYGENTVDPIILGGTLFISTGHGKGAALMDISTSAPRIIWENQNIANHFHNCVLIDQHLYGVHGNYGRKGTTLRCLNINSGDLLWEAPAPFGPITAAANRLIHLGERGKVTISRANNQAYAELASAQILPEPDDTGVRRSRVNRCWAPPVLAGGKLFIRNSYGHLVCIQMAP